MRRIDELLALPHCRAALLVQRDNRALPAAGGEDHLVTVQQGRFRETPFRPFPAEVFDVILPPLLGAGRRVDAEELAPLSDREYEPVVSRRRATRPGVAAPARRARPADVGRPEWFAVRALQGHDETFFATFAH